MVHSRHIFEFFVTSSYFKIYDVIMGIATEWDLHLFLLNPKYYQNEIRSNTIVMYDKHF